MRSLLEITSGVPNIGTPPFYLPKSGKEGTMNEENYRTEEHLQVL